MNEMMENSINHIARTHEHIAAEINSIKNQTRKMMLYNSIEIGRRLIEAKQLVAHGEWGIWLGEKVDYSQRTATNLMRIFEEYGADQLTLLEENAKSQAIANLSYTQAISLLGVPEEERENFIETHDIENMSTRELQKAIKEREQAIKEKEELEEKLKFAVKDAETSKSSYENVSQSYERLEKVNKEYYERTEKLKRELEETKKQISEAKEIEDDEEVEKLQASLNETESELVTSQKKIAELEQKLKEKPIEITAETIIEKVPEEVERELNELRKKVQLSNSNATKFSFIFDELVKKFRELLAALEEMKETDPEGHEKYKKAVSALATKMIEKL